MLSGVAASLSSSRNSKVSNLLHYKHCNREGKNNSFPQFYTDCTFLTSYVIKVKSDELFLLLLFLTDEMKTFAGQQIEPLFQFSWLVVFLTLLLCGSVALILGFTVDLKLAIAVSLTLLALLYIFFGEIDLAVPFCSLV